MRNYINIQLSKTFINHLGVMIAIILLMFFNNDLCAQNPSDNSKKVMTKQELIEKWKGIFPGSVDFSNQILFDAMVYIGPQPKEKMQAFGKKVIDEKVLSSLQQWYKTFFVDSLFLAIDTINPTHYYFPENGEASFIYYTLKYKQYKLEIYESFNGILMELEYGSVLGASNASLKNVELVNVLNKLTKLPVESEKIRQFNLPKKLGEGDIFKNTDTRIGLMRGWEDACVGFITENSICVTLFKAHGGRAQVGLTYDSEWLEKSLYESDGKTLVKRNNQL